MILKVPVEFYFVYKGERVEPLNPQWKYDERGGVAFTGEIPVDHGDVVQSIVATPFAPAGRLSITSPACGLLVLDHRMSAEHLSPNEVSAIGGGGA